MTLFLPLFIAYQKKYFSASSGTTSPLARIAKGTSSLILPGTFTTQRTQTILDRESINNQPAFTSLIYLQLG